MGLGRGRLRAAAAPTAVQLLPEGRLPRLGVRFLLCALRFRTRPWRRRSLFAAAGTTPAKAPLKRQARLVPARCTTGTAFRFSSLVEFVTVFLKKRKETREEH